MSSIQRPLDAAGHQRSPVTMPGYHQGRPPKNKGQRFPADPPPVEEIIAVMRAAGTVRTAPACERWSSCSGEPDSGSAKHSTSPRPTWTVLAGPY